MVLMTRMMSEVGEVMQGPLRIDVLRRLSFHGD